jgi:putative ABC transport system substrate-binding protein
MPSIQTAVLSLGVQATAAPVQTKDEIEAVIAAQARDAGGGLIVLPDTFNAENRELIIALVGRYNLPTMYYAANYARSGGLISYGPDFVELFRQAAGYIDRILKGANPAELSPCASTNQILAGGQPESRKGAWSDCVPQLAYDGQRGGRIKRGDVRYGPKVT